MEVVEYCILGYTDFGDSMSYNKLVRDKIPDIIKSSGEVPKTSVLGETEYKEELLKKLLEECHEVTLATNSKEVLEECADVLEVLVSIVELNDKTMDDLIMVRERKMEQRGGFKKRIFLEDVN